MQVRARATQKRCMKTCNAFALHLPTEEFVNFILSASELHEHVARDCRRAPPHKESLTHNQQKTTTTHSQYSAPDHGRCSPRQALGDKMIKIYYKDDGDYREGRASSSRRLRRQGQASASMCCCHHRPTGGGGLRSEGLSPAAREETEASRQQ